MYYQPPPMRRVVLGIKVAEDARGGNVGGVRDSQLDRVEKTWSGGMEWRRLDWRQACTRFVLLTSTSIPQSVQRLDMREHMLRHVSGMREEGCSGVVALAED
jgi:hypothetical protein